MPPKTSPVVLAARALGTPLDPGPEWLAYDARAGEITRLLREHKGKIFVRGRAPSTVNQATQFAQEAERLAAELKEMLQSAYEAAYDPPSGPVRALAILTSTGANGAVDRYARLMTTEHDHHAEAVEEVRLAYGRAIALRDRALLLSAELKRLNPRAPELDGASTLIDAASSAFDLHGYSLAATKAEAAIELLSSVRDPIAGLSESGAPDRVVTVIQDLRFAIATSPLTQRGQARLLAGLVKATDKLLEPDLPGCRRIVERVNGAFQQELRGFTTRGKKVTGLVQVGKTGLNALKGVGEPGDVVALEVEFHPWRTARGADSDEEVEELAGVVGRIEEARQRYTKAYEDAAAGLKRLDGFEVRIGALATWAEQLEPPFEWPVPLAALRSGFRELTDAVHGRSIRASQVAVDVKRLLDGEAADVAAKAAMTLLLVAVGEAQLAVTAKAGEVRGALRTVEQGLERLGVELEAMSNPPEDSAQWFNAALAEILDDWRAEVATCWKREAVASGPTLLGLALLQGRIEGGGSQDELVAVSKLATSLARYRAAHQEALEWVSAAVLIQDDTHQLAADTLALIGAVDAEQPDAEDFAAVDLLTRRHVQHTDQLKRYVRAQKSRLAVLRDVLQMKLDRAKELLDGAIEYDVTSPDKAQKKKEQVFATFLRDGALPELALFVGTDLPSVLTAAAARAQQVVYDALAIDKAVRGLSPGSGWGKTYSAVVAALKVARELLNKDGRVKKYRRAAWDGMTEQLDELDGRALEQPIQDSLETLTELKDGPEGIEYLWVECNLDRAARKSALEVGKATQTLLTKRSNKAVLKAALSTDELEALDRQAIPRPSPANGEAWHADALQQIKDLSKLAQPGESPREAETKLRALKQEVEQALVDKTVIVLGANKIAALALKKETNRVAFEEARDDHKLRATQALATDDSPSKLKSAHASEVDKDFDLAGKAFDASGDLETCSHMLLMALQKAERYGLGSEEAEARYAREQLPEHARVFAVNVEGFKAAVDTALNQVLAAADGSDGPELTTAGRKAVEATRARLKRAFRGTGFDGWIRQLAGHLSTGDKRKARKVREEALGRVRRYAMLLDEDPAIVMLAQSPAGGFGSASAPLRRSLTMLERTFLVSIPKGL